MPRIAVICAAALAFAATAAAATWPKLEKNAADQALASKSVLHLTDFTAGSGWKAAGADNSGGDVSVPSCEGPAFSQVGQVTSGSAATSFEATGLRVWSEAEVMKTIAMAQRDRNMASSAALMTCIRDAFEREMPAAVTFVSA